MPLCSMQPDHLSYSDGWDTTMLLLAPNRAVQMTQLSSLLHMSGTPHVIAELDMQLGSCTHKIGLSSPPCTL